MYKSMNGFSGIHPLGGAVKNPAHPIQQIITAEAVSKRMKKPLEAIISPLAYEIIVSFKIPSPLNCIIKAIIG
jgi:hypothetical protein